MSSEHPDHSSVTRAEDSKYEPSITPSEPPQSAKRLPPPSQTRTGDESDDEASEPPNRDATARADTPLSQASAGTTPSTSTRGSGVFSRLYNAPTASSLARGAAPSHLGHGDAKPSHSASVTVGAGAGGRQRAESAGGDDYSRSYTTAAAAGAKAGAGTVAGAGVARDRERENRRASAPRPGSIGITPLASAVVSDTDERRRHSSGPPTPATGPAAASGAGGAAAGANGAPKPPRPTPAGGSFTTGGALPGFMGPKGGSKGSARAASHGDQHGQGQGHGHGNGHGHGHGGQGQGQGHGQSQQRLTPTLPTAPLAFMRPTASSLAAVAASPAAPSPGKGSSWGSSSGRVSPLHTRARASNRSERAPIDAEDTRDDRHAGGPRASGRQAKGGARRDDRGGSESDVSEREGCGSLCMQGKDDGSGAKPIEGVLTVVVFGASGDLAAKKTYPALAGLAQRELLPKALVVVGVARTKMGEEEFRKKISENLPKPHNPAAADAQKAFLSSCYYHSGGYDDPESFSALATELDRLEAAAAGAAKGQKDVTRVLYLAVPPDVFAPIADLSNKFLRPTIGESPSASPSNGDKGRLHVVVEKPFGHDLASARALNASLRAGFAEREIFRIDHYLAKEMAQNLTVLRFANRCFEPLWNNQHIQSVTIAFKEDIGIGSRAGYFDNHGAILDVLQNHVLQLLALTAMEPPVTLAAEDVRDEKVKLLRAVANVLLDEVVVGQYTEALPSKGDKSKGEQSKGDQSKGDQSKGCAYRNEPDVPPTSTTETFAAVVLRIENSRWSGVPFILKCGKGLNEGKTEIRIQFKRPENALFSDIPMNELVIKVKPRDSVYLKLCSKRPGLTGAIAVTELDFTVEDRFPTEARESVDAYERLIFDVTHGDRSLFVRNDELMQSWRIMSPLVAAVRDAVKGQGELAPDTAPPSSPGCSAKTSGHSKPKHQHQHQEQKLRLIGYPRGSRGPVAADALAARVGFESSAGTYSWAPPAARAAAAAEAEARVGAGAGAEKAKAAAAAAAAGK